MENKKWIIICIIGGILMILSGTVGNISFYETIFNPIMRYISAIAPILKIILQIFSYIAMGGGISVIIGAILVSKGSYGVGKFIIGLGAGMSLLGLIIFLISGLIGGSLVADMKVILLEITNGSYGFIGVLLTIFARMKLKKE